MLLPLFWYGIGAGALLAGTRLLLINATRLSAILRISPLVLGSTVVALGTSLPELTIAITALIVNDAPLALGNIVGSNVVNLLFILPIGILMGNMRVGTTKTQWNSVLLGGATLLFVMLPFLSPHPQSAALLLMALGGAVTVLEYRWGIQGRHAEDGKRFSKKNVKAPQGTFLHLCMGLGGVIFGGLITVHAAEAVASSFHIGASILGLSLVAFTTTLPELFTTIHAQRAGEEKVALGNLLGSNVYNLLIIGGLLFLSNPTVIPETPWLIGTSIVTMGIVRVYRGRIIPRWVGMCLLCLCGWYGYSISASP